jgi:predicted dehydrogenase
MTLRWGIIGPGAIARVFASDLAILDPSQKDHRISAVGSRDLVRAAQFAKEFGIEEGFGSYSQVSPHQRSTSSMSRMCRALIIML